MLVIPALATLIYAAFVRFTRTLDLKDKKTLQRLRHQNDSVQRGSGAHHNDQDCAKKCDLVDDASSFSSEYNQEETSKLGKHHQSSIDLSDDGGGDGSWGNSKDFNPMHSDGLRRRLFSMEKTHITDSSTFRQLINWSSEHLSDDPEDPNHMERTAEDRSHSGDVAAEKGAASSTVQIRSLLPGCSIAHIISNTTHHADFSSSMCCPKSNGCLVEEDAVQTALPGPKSDLPAIAEMHPEGIENESSKFHVSEDNRTPFISEEEQVSLYAVERIECHSGTSGFTLCSQEIEKTDVGGGLCFVKISPELSFLSSPELVVEGGKDASEKEPCDLDKKEENNVAINLEEEALLGVPLVNTAEPDYRSAGFSFRPQDSNMMAVPAVTNIFSVIPESNNSASVKVLAENYEDSKDDQISDVHLTEQKVHEDFLDPLVVDSFEDSFALEFLSRSAAAEMTEVLGVVKQGLSEGASDHQNDVVASSDDGGDAENAISDSVSGQLTPEANIMESLQDVQETLSDPLHCSLAAEMTEVMGVVKEGLSEGASNHQNDVVASSDDGGDAMNEISDPVSVQLIPEANIMEGIQDVQETLSDPVHHSSFRSGFFFSLSEINNVEAYSSYQNFLYANSVENEESLASKGGSSVSKDEMNFAFLDTSILLNEVTSIPESNITQSLHDGKQALPMSSERANFDLEGSLISLDQEINLEMFSLYSRSSSCVSEVNMTEALSVGRFPALKNDNDFSFEDMTSMMVTDVKHAEDYTHNARSAEFIPEINMTETLNAGKEATARLEHEVSSNFDTSLKAADVGNGIEKLDNSLDFLWSFDPVVDSSEGLQAAQEFSTLQSENDFTFVKTNVTTKDVNNDGDLQKSKETSIDAAGSVQPGLSMSEEDGVSTLRGTCMSPDRVIDFENVLTANYTSDLRSTVGNRFFSQKASPKAQSQDPLIFKESLLYPDEVSIPEKNSGNAKLLFCSTEVNLIESLDGDQMQQQDETNSVSEDTYMACQGSTSENCLDSLGYQHISDANMTKTLQSAGRLSSEISHDGSFCIVGNSVCLDGGNDTDNSSANPGSEMRTAQNNTAVLLGFQGPEQAVVSTSQYEVASAEKIGSDSLCAEATMTRDIQGVNKSPSQSQEELPGTYVSTDKANSPEYSRSSSSMTDDNLIELAACQERSFHPKDENPSSFQETSPSESLSDNLMCASDTSKKESVTFSMKESPDPSLEDVDSFDKVSVDEQANKSLKENALGCDQIARTQAEGNCTENHIFTEASKLNCTDASESVSEGFLEPEHQEPELVLSQVGMPFFIDEDQETKKYLGSSSTACALETLQVLPGSAGSEKGFLEGSKACEWHCTDKVPKDKVKDMEEDVQDFDEDHENSR